MTANVLANAERLNQGCWFSETILTVIVAYAYGCKTTEQKSAQYNFIFRNSNTVHHIRRHRCTMACSIIGKSYHPRMILRISSAWKMRLRT